MHATAILQYLKKHGQQLDSDIAAGIRIPLADVRPALKELSARGEISSCGVTHFNNGKPVQRMLCRIMGTVPQAAPGRKPGAAAPLTDG